MIKYLPETPEFSDIVVTSTGYAWDDNDGYTYVNVTQNGDTISFSAEDVDSFIEAVVLAAAAAIRSRDELKNAREAVEA